MYDSDEKELPYVATDEASAILHCEIKVLANSRKSGKLYDRPAPKYLKVGPRKVLYRRADLIAWLESCEEVDPSVAA